MHKTLLKNKDAILELVNDKIEYVYSCVHHDGGHPVLDYDELDALLKCVKILEKLGELHHIDHEIKMDFHGHGNPHPSMDAAMASTEMRSVASNPMGIHNPY